jgi:AbrB family looped-hinge helix DNA binding protein
MSTERIRSSPANLVNTIDDGRIYGMITTIDSAGRIVLPKIIRDRAQLTPGIPIEVRLVDGRVELEPACAEVAIEKRGGLWVAATKESVPVLTADQVDATIEAIRVPSIPVVHAED